MQTHAKILVKIKERIKSYRERQWPSQKKWIIIAGCLILGCMVWIGFRPSAEGTCESAPLSAAELYEKGQREYHQGNYSEAVAYYRSAAEKGLAAAMNDVAWCYLKGNGVQADESTAFQWYKKAAQQNHTRAMYNLGKCYDEGWGVDKDTYSAYKWYKMGAEKDDEQAQNALAWCYWKGKGVEVDKRLAVIWYSRAAQQLHPRAMYNLACLWEELRNELRDIVKKDNIWTWLKVKIGMREDEDLTTTINALYYQSAILKDKLAIEKVKELNITTDDCIPLATLLVRLGAVAAGVSR